MSAGTAVYRCMSGVVDDIQHRNHWCTEAIVLSAVHHKWVSAGPNRALSACQ